MNQNAPSSLLFVLSAALGACLCMAACGTSDGESLQGLFGGSAGGCPSLETPKARFCCQAARCFSEGGDCSGSEIADSCNASDESIAADVADQVVAASCNDVRNVAYRLPLGVSDFAEGCGIGMQGGGGGGGGMGGAGGSMGGGLGGNPSGGTGGDPGGGGSGALSQEECDSYCDFFDACPDSGFSTGDFTCEEQCELFPDGVRCILGEVLEDGVYSCGGASAGLNCAGEFAGGFLPGF